jgi:hypothetical protein
MADVISFRADAARGRFGGTEVADLSAFDTLECPYCDRSTPPAQVLANWTVIYRCSCRKVFRVTEGGSVWRGLRGPAFPYRIGSRKSTTATGALRRRDSSFPLRGGPSARLWPFLSEDQPGAAVHS